MSNQSNSEEEIRLFVQELANVKEALRETSRQLLRIERRVTAAFPSVAKTTRDRTKQSSSEKRFHLDEAAAQRVIAGLKERISKGEQIESQLADYSVKPNLQIIAKILGMTNVKLPPKDELVRRISTRLRQSVSVTTGFHEEVRSFTGSNEKVR